MDDEHESESCSPVISEYQVPVRQQHEALMCGL